MAWTVVTVGILVVCFQIGYSSRTGCSRDQGSPQTFPSGCKLPKRCVRYRQLDGTCNHPRDYGSANTPVRRILKPHYQPNEKEKDGPRVFSVRGRQFRLPSPRLISLKLHPDRRRKSPFTLLVMQMGQLVDHDITQAPISKGDRGASIKCCNVPRSQMHRECFPIDVPDFDPDFKNCMEFVRSQPVIGRNGKAISPREQINILTAFVDASSIYGDDVKMMRKLRTQNGAGALLKTRRVQGKARLPKDSDSVCVTSDHPLSYCQMAGDHRVNEQPGLSSLHLVFHLYHNTVVRALAKVKLDSVDIPSTSDVVDSYIKYSSVSIRETLFQEARKIMSGILQKITYCDWLPLVIGPRLIKDYGLGCDKACTYSPSADPRVSNAFLTAAFRFGHSLIPNAIMVDNKRKNLKNMFRVPDATLFHFESIIPGLCRSGMAPAFDRFVSRSVRTDLFKTQNLTLDLIAINIQRGRDHGIPSYYHWKKHFGLGRFTQMEQLGRGFLAKTLKQLYRDPRDVDLFTAGLLETPVEGGIVGPTFGNILAEQFSQLKFGDAYFFLTRDTTRGFTEDQRQAINKVNMAHILCSMSRMGFIQTNPFFEESPSNPLVACKELPDLDLTSWKDNL